LLVIACALVALAGLAGACSDPETPEPAGEASPEPPDGEAAPEGIDGVVVVRAAGREHVNGAIDYDTYPPAGGNHFGTWQNCGFFAEPVPDEMAVHSLEHGAVWIAYTDDLPQEQLDQLDALAGDETHVLVAPYPDLRAPLVLSAWERQLDLDSVDDPRFQEFLDTYLEGPTTPEPGAPCSGGADCSGS
jgi:hypothetical protein